MNKFNLYEVKIYDSSNHYVTNYVIAHCEYCAKRKCRSPYRDYPVYYNRVTKHILVSTSYEELHPAVKEYTVRKEMDKAHQKLLKIKG